MLIVGLTAMQADCRVCSAAYARMQLPRMDAGDVLWVDSLFLDLLPALARMPGRRARLGLLLHYLPSLVARGQLTEAADLSLAEREALIAADVIMVPSPYMRETVERLASPAAPVIVIEPGRLALGPAHRREPPVRAVMVANLVPGKGALPFLRSFAECVRPDDDCHLEIVGSLALDADHGQACRRAARDPRLQGRVHFLGQCTPESAVKRMASCNLGQCRVLPEGISSLRATLAANLETALNVVWDAGISLGDDVVVVGAGIVGLLVVYLAKRAGAASVLVVEPSSRRREAAVVLGADIAVSPADDAPRARADVVVEATGQPVALDRAIEHAGDEGTVVVASFYGERCAPVVLGGGFHRRRLNLKASQVSRLPAAKAPRWNVDRRWQSVLGFLSDRRLDALLDPPVPFAEAEGWFARLSAGSTAALQIAFAYGEMDGHA
jgi:NADPH:quinone reductase-like Zn-dependent oxidoreductase